MTPVMFRSPEESWAQMESMTMGWLLWFFWELPSVYGVFKIGWGAEEGGLTAAIDHDARMMFWSRLLHTRHRASYVLACVVRALGASAEDDVHVLVTFCADYGRQTLFGYAHEGVRVGGGAHGVYGYYYAVERSVRGWEGLGEGKGRGGKYLPSVPFLKPIGKETPEASSLCNWDSVVRAPIAPQEITIV
jgi:hypothetical protein